MFEKYRMLIAPITLIIISLIMKFSKSKKLGFILDYNKYWLIIFVLGVLLFFVKYIDANR